jgi:hypothetical protein
LPQTFFQVRKQNGRGKSREQRENFVGGESKRFGGEKKGGEE